MMPFEQLDIVDELARLEQKRKDKIARNHKPHDCDYCNLVYYSKGALTRHEKAEHWRELEEENERSS